MSEDPAPSRNGRPPMSQRVARRLAGLALGWPGTTLLVGLAVAAIGLGLAARLTLETDLSELLPPNAPSVIALKRLNQRVGGTGNVAIAIETLDGNPHPEVLRAYVPLLVSALEKELGSDLLSIKYERKQVADYYGRFAAWYVPIDDLQRWTDRLGDAVAREVNPMIVSLDDDEGGRDAMRKLVDEVRGARQKAQETAGFSRQDADAETGLLMSEGGRIAAVFVRPAANSLNLGGSKGMLDRIKRIAESTDPEKHGVRIPGYTGSIPTAIQEVHAVVRDIVGTALLVVALVGGVVALYFRGVRELLLLSGALIVGVAVALGFADLWIGHVNFQTAFLGSIIVGTGINYGIILLDRYRSARAREASFEAALEAAIGDTLRATWIAALSTAVSFGVLSAGEVESFHQFGWIGGVGILACWVATFTLVPASVVLADRKRAPRGRSRFRPLESLFGLVGRSCEKAPAPIVAVVAAMVVGSGFVAMRARGHLIETDMDKLATRSSRESGIQKLDRRLRDMDDRSSTPAVIATDDRADTVGVCEVLGQRARTDLKGLMNRCYSIDSLLPTERARREALLARLRRDLDKVPEEDLTPSEKRDLADLERQVAERAPTDADLPASLKEYFVERDGAIGKLAFIEPRNENLEANLYKFSDAMRSVRLPSGKVIESSGDLVVFADVLRAMRKDARRLTLASAALVLLVLGVVTRRAGTFLRVGGALCAGVAIMVGAAVLLGDKLNFFNFVALPTTFGIGIDYAINIDERIRLRGRGRLARAVAESGPAVLLASLTSIFGYASLLTADSRALCSFGALAIVGEVCCVVVASVLVPSLWALGKAGEPAAADAAEPSMSDAAE